MLQNIRKWAHGWMAWAVISMIGIVFVIWGIGANFGELFGSGKAPAALIVGNDQFTQAEIDTNYQKTLAEYKNAMAAQHMQLKPEDEASIQKMAQQRLIMESVLNQFLIKDGFIVSKQQVDAFMSRVPQLQEGGQFSMALYQAMLEQRHQTPADFSKEMQDRMVFMQASAAIGGSAIILPDEMQTATSLIYQTRDIGYALLDSKDFEKDIQITDTDLQAYYNGHHSEFTVPAQATVEYIILTRQQIADEVRQQPVPQADLEALYASHQADYTLPESRQLSHILIVVPEDATEAVRADKKKEAQDLLDQLNKGADFATLAKEHSEDPGSAGEGGDLGVTIKGTFDPAFDQAAFSAPQGKVVGPVETPFGYHLILVTAIEPAQIEPLSEVKNDLSEEWYQTETTKRFDAAVKNLSDMAFQAGTEFGDLAKEFNLTPVVANVSKDSTKNEGVMKIPAVVDAAFDKSAYDQKLNSELIPIGADQALVLRTTNYKDSYLKSFDSVKEELSKAALIRQSLRMAEEKAGVMIQAMESGTSAQDAAQAQGVEWKTQENLDRRNKDVPYEVVMQAFKTPLSDDKPARATAPTLTGIAILEVTAIHPGKTPAFQTAEEERAFNENLKSQLAEFIARRDFDLFGEYAKREIVR